MYSFDPVGSYQRDSFKAGGSASAMLQPLLDNQVIRLRPGGGGINTKCLPCILFTSLGECGSQRFLVVRCWVCWADLPHAAFLSLFHWFSCRPSLPRLQLLPCSHGLEGASVYSGWSVFLVLLLPFLPAIMKMHFSPSLTVSVSPRFVF